MPDPTYDVPLPPGLTAADMDLLAQARDLPLAQREALYSDLRQEVWDELADVLSSEDWKSLDSALTDALDIPGEDVPVPPIDAELPATTESDGDFSDAAPECGFACTALAWGAAIGNAAYGAYQTVKNAVLKINPKDAAHVGLDIAGLIPLYGEPIDAAHALWYVYEEEYLDAALTLLSVIPGVGDAIGKGAKYALKAGGAALIKWWNAVQKLGGLPFVERLIAKLPSKFREPVLKAFREFWERARNKLRSESGALGHFPSSRIQEAAEDIATGHAWGKHQADWVSLGFKTPQGVSFYLREVMKGGPKVLERPLSGGRYAWFDLEKNVVIIFNPNNIDKGTAFVPDPAKWPNAVDYFWTRQ